MEEVEGKHMPKGFWIKHVVYMFNLMRLHVFQCSITSRKQWLDQFCFFFILFLNPPTDSVPLFPFLHPICFLPPPSSLLRDRGRICCWHLKLRFCWWFPSRILQRASKSAGSRGIDTNKTITCGEQHSGFEQQQKTHKLIIIITNPSNSQSRCTCVCGEQLEVCASVPQLFTHVTEDETLSTN